MQGISLTDRSGTITLGGTSQQAMADNPKRRYLLVQPLEEDSYINFGGAATAGGAGSIKLAMGNAYIEAGESVPTQAVFIISATTGKKFTAKEG